jgi:hypothetical protein
MKDLSRFTLTELLLTRQFLVFYSNVTNIKGEDVRNANSTLAKVDKEIWSRVISNNTPWGKVEPRGLTFEDEEFDKTIEELTAGKFDEGETQK